MAVRIPPTRWAALGAALLMVVGTAHEGDAGPFLRPALGPAPGCTGSDCTPRAATFGHYETHWRRWPAERRPDQRFPQSLGAEPMVTPLGLPEKSLPVERFVPEGGPPQPTGPRLPTDLPPVLPSDLPDVPGPPAPTSPLETPPLEKPSEKPAGQEILPPGGKIQIEEKSPLGTQPSPLEPLPAETTPKLPLEPTTPPAEEKPAESRLPGMSDSPPAPDQGTSSTLPGLAPREQRPVEAPAAKADEGAGWMEGPPPAAPENVPIPVEPWAEPRAWQPAPAQKATYEVPWSPPPQSWEPPAAPRRERPVEPPMARPVRESLPATIEPELPPPLEEPVRPPAVEPSEPRPSEPVAQARGAPQNQPPMEPPASRPAEAQTPAENLPLGLDGYCPVKLAEHEQWVAGQQRFAVKFNGHIYLMSDETLQRRFLANPTRYAPVMAGVDPVLAIDKNVNVPGQTEFCVVYDGRLYMFSNASTLARFHQNPKRYSAVATKATY